jgi:deazaflavin-dependent oxidoreductase (nitroreductase family)
MTMPEDIKAHNRALIEEFRANGGAPGRQLLLLTTTGRRTGQRRTTPMMYVEDGDRLLVIASNAGATQEPDWCRNLRADPGVTVEITGETYPAIAFVTTGPERDRLFERICEGYPFFRDHQAKAGRTIPVVALERT